METAAPTLAAFFELYVGAFLAHRWGNVVERLLGPNLLPTLLHTLARIRTSFIVSGIRPELSCVANARSHGRWTSWRRPSRADQLAAHPALSNGQSQPSDAACQSPDPTNIMVCGRRPQPYRPDPSVVEAGRGAERNSRSAISATPVAQAACIASKAGCTKDLSSLDIANVAFLVGRAAVKAARGDDWTRAFRTGGPDQYQLYQQAKRRREAEAQERAAGEAKRRAEAEEQQSRAAKSHSG